MRSPLSIVSFPDQWLPLSLCPFDNITCVLLYDAMSSVELDSLGPLLGQIVVALSPVIPNHPKTVAEVFDFLIIENK